MRVDKTKELRTVTTYLCEICGRKSHCSSDIIQCERNHKESTCEHPDWEYEDESRDDWGTIVGIRRQCQVCDKSESIDFEGLHEGTLRDVWQTIKPDKPKDHIVFTPTSGAEHSGEILRIAPDGKITFAAHIKEKNVEDFAREFIEHVEKLSGHRKCES